MAIGGWTSACWSIGGTISGAGTGAGGVSAVWEKGSGASAFGGEAASSAGSFSTINSTGVGSDTTGAGGVNGLESRPTQTAKCRLNESKSSQIDLFRGCTRMAEPGRLPGTDRIIRHEPVVGRLRLMSCTYLGQQSWPITLTHAWQMLTRCHDRLNATKSSIQAKTGMVHNQCF